MELVNRRWWSFIKMKITKNLKYPDLFAGIFPGYSFGENHVFELFENKLLFLEFRKKQGFISVFDIEIVIDRQKYCISR